MEDNFDINNYAYIHSTESFGTVDGPGIRFIVFMQGCPLKCKYCHNRDTWQTNTGKTMHVDELINEILKYKDYFKSSGGGVTVSGGEPLLQSKFLITLFKKLKAKKINTCLDTAGSIPISDDIKELLKYTDLVLLDIKHIDDKKCIELTSKSNKNNIEFAKYLSDNNIPVWIRQVLVPGYTDDEKDLLKLKDFISSLKNVQKVDILPYHDMGKYKWTDLGEKYPLESVRTATNDDVIRANKIIDFKLDK